MAKDRGCIGSGQSNGKGTGGGGSERRSQTEGESTPCLDHAQATEVALLSGQMNQHPVGVIDA